MKKWEYKTVLVCGMNFFAMRKKLDVYKIDKVLNKMGEEGWELVTSKTASQGWGVQDGILCIFKRCTNQSGMAKHLKLTDS